MGFLLKAVSLRKSAHTKRWSSGASNTQSTSRPTTAWSGTSRSC
jgi:hypothetical protein